MSSVAVIRAQVESRIPGALRVYERSTPEVFPTGIAAIDRETGGIPKGALTQVSAPAGVTSGRTTCIAIAFGASNRQGTVLCLGGRRRPAAPAEQGSGRRNFRCCG